MEAATALIKQCGFSSPVGDWLDLPQPVELCIRESADRNEQLIFLLNSSDERQSITLQWPATDAVIAEYRRERDAADALEATPDHAA